MDSEAQLEAALQAGDFETIPELAAAYRRTIALRLARTSDPAARRTILQQSREILNSCLQLAKVRRARIAARLQAAEDSVYQSPHPRLHSWEIEA